MIKSHTKKKALIVFAKEPTNGKVKTRLLESLPTTTVTNLYKAFVKDVLGIAAQVPCDQRTIYYTGAKITNSFLIRFKKDFQYRQQRGKDLGRRMYRAFLNSQREKYDCTIIIGTDCLSLRPKDIEKAFRKLSEYDCVLGPSKDGGYYLIGLKSPLKECFQGIKWSSDQVFDETIKKLRKHNKRVYLLNIREDIDTMDGLRNFLTLIRKKRMKSSVSQLRHKIPE